MPKRFLAVLLCAAISAFAADPPPSPVAIRVVSPEADAVVPSNDVDVFVQAENLSLPEGADAVRVVLDNGAPRTLADLRAPLTLRGLPEGGHTLRVVALHPDGLALENPEASALVHFYVRRRDFQNAADPAKPYLTVNLPLDRQDGPPLQGRVWFDFVTANAPLGKEGGYVVRCTLNQKVRLLSAPQPLFWDDLAPGRYELTAELLTSDLRPVPGPFNRVVRSFDVQPAVKALPAAPATPFVRQAD